MPNFRVLYLWGQAVAIAEPFKSIPFVYSLLEGSLPHRSRMPVLFYRRENAMAERFQSAIQECAKCLKVSEEGTRGSV